MNIITNEDIYLAYCIGYKDAKDNIFDEDFGNDSSKTNDRLEEKRNIRRHLPKLKKERAKANIHKGGVQAYKNNTLALANTSSTNTKEGQ